MAGEIQLNGVSLATESSGTITINNGTIGSSVVMAANQACVKTAINASGSAPIFACRAWINFDGTAGTIGTGRGSGNMDAVTDHGTGDFTVNFTTDMEDANYCVLISASDDAGNLDSAPEITNRQAGSCRFETKYTGNQTKFNMSETHLLVIS